jgi:hypothetical protein
MFDSALEDFYDRQESTEWANRQKAQNLKASKGLALEKVQVRWKGTDIVMDGQTKISQQDTPTSLDPRMDRLIEIFNALAPEKQGEFLALSEEFLQKAKHQPPPLPEVCPREKTYDVWKVANKSKDGKQCLKENWWPWLKEFNDDLDRDYMSQADLRKLDVKLLQRLQNTYASKELNKLIPTLPALNDQINASRMTPEKIKEALEIRNYVVSRGLAL